MDRPPSQQEKEAAEAFCQRTSHLSSVSNSNDCAHFTAIKDADVRLCYAPPAATQTYSHSPCEAVAQILLCRLDPTMDPHFSTRSWTAAWTCYSNQHPGQDLRIHTYWRLAYTTDSDAKVLRALIQVEYAQSTCTPIPCALRIHHTAWKNSADHVSDVTVCFLPVAGGLDHAPTRLRCGQHAHNTPTMLLARIV